VLGKKTGLDQTVTCVEEVERRHEYTNQQETEESSKGAKRHCLKVRASGAMSDKKHYSDAHVRLYTQIQF
jgi:hypothetical protein